MSIQLQTANGTVVVDEFATINVPSLGITVEALVLEETATVLSQEKCVTKKDSRISNAQVARHI